MRRPRAARFPRSGADCCSSKVTEPVGTPQWAASWLSKPRGVTTGRHIRTALTLNRSTISQLRDDIDAGRTGDKVDWPDPAAVPLGTDEEAAGTPPDSWAVETARALEVSRPNKSISYREVGAAWLLIIFAVGLGAGLVAWILWQSS